MEGFNYSQIFTGAESEIMNGLTSAAPVAGAVFGIVIAISIGVKIFSRLAKKEYNITE